MVADNYFPTVESGIPMYGVKGFYVAKETLMQGQDAPVADMRFRITAIMEPGQAPRQFETGLAPFSGGIGSELVRNHIYRFDVKAFNTILDLDVNVSDWIVQSDEFELDNIVSVEPDGFMKWEYDANNFAVTTETYNGNAGFCIRIANKGHKYIQPLYVNVSR